MAVPVIDTATFEELRETTGDDFLAELIDTYCQETPLLIAQLRQALAEGDAETFRRAAHSIKSNANSLGALDFGVQARELEMIGKSGNLAGVAVKVQSLADAYSQVEEALLEKQHGA
jgi:histidine phosphotransfer protein HptB